MPNFRNDKEAQISPFKVSPVFLEKIWGGQTLGEKLHKNIPQDIKIGESWELSGENPYHSIIADGPHMGRRLADVCKEYGSKLLGSNIANDEFPLLYKFIDANDMLSVQVHPDDSQAIQQHLGVRGKTECWYIVDAAPGATIIVGLKKSMSPEEMQTSINSGTFREILSEEHIAAGDLFFIPAGTIHAIMSDTLIYEVQESSDITLRVYDWDRLDDSGKPRQLHIKDAVKVTDTFAHESYKIKPVSLSYEDYTHSYRVACKYFLVEQYIANKQTSITLPVKKSFSVLTIMKGSVTLSDSMQKVITVNSGESVLIPAMSNNCFVATSAGSEMLLSSVPDLMNEVIIPLKKLDVTEKDILGLGGVVEEKNDILGEMRGLDKDGAM